MTETAPALLLPHSPDRSAMGGKGAALARLAQAGFRVPPFAVLPVGALLDSLPPDDRAAWDEASPEARREVAERARLSEPWRAALDAWATRVGAETWAVRSSAAGEDGAAASFAGQLESLLGVGREGLAEAVAEVWRSGFAPRVLAYRRENGVAGPPEAPAVVVQAMVDARAAGVAFGADPVSGDPAVRVVAAVHGLGSALVDGREDGETWRVGASGGAASREASRQRLADRLADRLASGGVEAAPAPQADVLSEAEARAVADLATRATEAFGHPQDIEWAFGPLAGEGGAPQDASGARGLPNPSRSSPPPRQRRGAPGQEGAGVVDSARRARPGLPPLSPPGQGEDSLGASGARGRAEGASASPQPPVPRPLWLLQSRPITTVQTGRLRVWDNSNIAESYGGVTSPLTFSFARRAYAAVYREFCALLGVSGARIEAEAETFDAMLGLLRGRVYYNLASWYRVLALLPGYRLNAPMMEGMMGVREGIPDEVRPAPATGGKLRDALALGRSAFGLVWAAITLGRRQRQFMARLERALAPVDLGAMDLDALAAHYRDLEAELLRKWDAPLVNDFFAMIAFGVADKLAARWLPPGLLGHLLSGDGDIVSAEPARRIRAMARPLAPEAARALMRGDAEAVLRENEPLAEAVADYLEVFGDRCLEELKLESPTLADDPAPLYAAIGAAALRETAPTPEATPTASGAARPQALREDAESTMREALRGHPIRRLVFGRALGLARRRVRDRENLRFERTRVFGRARRIVLAMGDRLAARGRLRDARDVFHLEIGELLGAVDGTATAWDLQAVAAARAAEFERHHAAPAPPERVLTRGAVATATLVDGFAGRSPEAANRRASGEGEDPNARTGLGCCAGVVEGPVRVVRDPRGVTLEPGTLLVAERTDPGWILLFPMCAGLVVERGSLLSHSAIVAREMGIPCAVSVAGATGWLRDGDRVRLDGGTGRVERAAPAADDLARGGDPPGRSYTAPEAASGDG